jgi:virginiamycin B lyase
MGGPRAAVAVACAVVWALSLGATAAGETAPDPAKLQGALALAAGSDGALWVVDSLGVMRVTLDGHFTRMLQADQLRRITRGPDGAMWFTQLYPARIGRIGADGSVDWFSAGISHAPVGITSAPDGNLWFAEPNGAVGRITPAGSVTEFAKARTQPVEITAGRDGNLWFSDYSGRIGRVTPAGDITEFAVPYRDSGPEAIATGPDGALWYGTDGHVGRMTTAGRARLFKVPFLYVHGIALGSDGNMWVTGYVPTTNFGAAVARVTPRGKVRLFRRGLSGLHLEGIASGPGRALSVAELGRQDDDGIARVSTTGAVRELPRTPPCKVPAVARFPLALVDDVAFNALCRVDGRSRRAGKRPGTVALGVSPKPGSTVPFNTALRVRFGRVPPLPRHCRLPFGGRRLASSPTVLAYSYTDYDPDYIGESKTHYGACLRPNGPLHPITSSIDELTYYEEASGFKTSGVYVVYTFFSEDHYGFSDLVLRVYDVRHGRRVSGRRVEHHDGDLPDAADNPVLGEYVVSEHGAVAWLSQEGSTTRLFAQARRRAKRELDSGASLSGLSFAGDTLSWTAGSGERRSAEVR